MLTLFLLALAQQAPSRAAEAADRFALDLPADDTVTTPPEASPSVTATSTTFSLDTPIAALIADPGARAVLDRNLPGLSTDENLPKFAKLSLRKFAPLTGGQLTANLLEQTAYDLAALGAGGAPARPVTATGRKLSTGR